MILSPAHFLLCGSLLLSVLGSRAAASDPTHPVQKDLQTIRENLAREKKLLTRLQRQSSSLLQTVSVMDQELHSAQTHAQQVERELAAINAKLEEQEQLQRDSNAALAGQKQRLHKRVRSLYKMGQYGWMNLLFGSHSVTEGLARVRWLQRRARADSRLLVRTKRLRELLTVSQREIKAKRAQQKVLLRKLQNKRQLSARAWAEKTETLKLLQKEESLRRRLVQELTQSRQRLGQVISAIAGLPAQGKGFRKRRGRLPPPVRGARIEIPFGVQKDQRFKTVTRHAGVDLRAPLGTAVTAVFAGQVVFAKQFEGYGLLVIIDHGAGYFSLYAHLSQLAVTKGNPVLAGQIVGKLGDTGSLKGPYLYFEVREDGRAVDPEKWIRF